MNATLQPVVAIEAIEDAIVAALAADATVSSYAAFVGGFQGTVAQSIGEVAMRDPAFLVLFQGITTEEQGAEGYVGTIEWHIVVRARNLRGASAARKSQGTSEIGAYGMVLDAVRVLGLQSLGLDIRPLEFLGAELQQTGAQRDRTLTSYDVVFSCDVDFRLVDGTDEAVPLTELDATYQAPDGSGTFAAVAGDTIPVETA